MGELGASIPKALIEVEGRTLLERSIETLKSIGVSRIIVVVGHLGEKIVELDLGVEIAYQENRSGLRTRLRLPSRMMILSCFVQTMFTRMTRISSTLARFLNQTNPCFCWLEP